MAALAASGESAVCFSSSIIIAVFFTGLGFDALLEDGRENSNVLKEYQNTSKHRQAKYPDIRGKPETVGIGSAVIYKCMRFMYDYKKNVLLQIKHNNSCCKNKYIGLLILFSLREVYIESRQICQKSH